MVPDRKFLLFLTALLAMAAPASAAPRASDKPRYDNCLALTGSNPAAALGEADKWIQEGGGTPAQHCAAVALVGLKRYAEAGTKLDALGRAPDAGTLRAALLDQAGNAWLLAGDAVHASASFQGALALSANDPDLYADLGRALALQKDWRGAESELNAALAIAPGRTDLLVLRASAHHASGNFIAARADADRALKLGATGETADSARRLLAALDEAAQTKQVPAPKPVPKPKPTPPAH